MRLVRNISLGFVLAFIGLMNMPVQAADAAIVVALQSGRKFAGEIDPASSAEQLVLKTTTGGITVQRPIQWKRIVEATVDGKRVEVAGLRLGLGGRGSGVGPRGTLLRKIELRGAVVPASTEVDVAAEEVRAQVTMVNFDPYIANWDADVETDGLMIDIVPLDGEGFLIPCNGTLTVELFGQQRRTLDLAPQSGGATLELVERWTREISAEDFGPNGVRLKLPFGAIHPELRPDWLAWWYGLVHVRLAIPGQGVFEGSRDGIRMRPFAPNRDRLEMRTGERFLPTETLGRRE
jgi:hypothetical protein